VGSDAQMSRMLVYDWYDGPIGGVVTLSDERSFCFFLVDWDTEHRIRIFALQHISDEFGGMTDTLADKEAKWPVWFPSDFVEPSERALEWVAAVRSLRQHPESVDAALVWDSCDDRAIAIRGLPPEDTTRPVPWFDAVELPEGPRDWFGLLSVQRS